MPQSYADRQSVECRLLRSASGFTRGVYHYLDNLQHLAERHGRRWIMPSQNAVAAALSCHPRTVRRAMAWLTARGLLIRHARYRTGQFGRYWRKRLSDRMQIARSAASALAALAVPASRPPHSGDNSGRAQSKAVFLDGLRPTSVSKKPVPPPGPHIPHGFFRRKVALE